MYGTTSNFKEEKKKKIVFLLKRSCHNLVFIKQQIKKPYNTLQIKLKKHTYNKINSHLLWFYLFHLT